MFLSEPGRDETRRNKKESDSSLLKLHYGWNMGINVNRGRQVAPRALYGALYPPVSPFLKKLQKSVIDERRAKHGIFQNDPTSSYRIIHWNGGIEAISNCVIILVAWTILLFIPKRERKPRYSWWNHPDQWKLVIRYRNKYQALETKRERRR